MELENNEAALHNYLEDENLVVGINADDVRTDPTIILEGVRDSIVSSKTAWGRSLSFYFGVLGTHEIG